MYDSITYDPTHDPVTEIGHNKGCTIVVGQVWQSIVLKIDVKVVGKIFFSKPKQIMW